MANIQSISTNLLKTALPNENITALVYHHADLKVANLVLASPLPAPMALASARDDGWQAAAMQAMSATDQEVITTLARDQRVRVRAALARNPHLPPGVSQELWEWTQNHPGDETRVARPHLLGTIDVTWFAQNALGEVIADADWIKITRRCVASERREVYEAFAHTQHGDAFAHFAAQLTDYLGDPPYSLSELVALRPPERSTGALSRAAALSGSLSAEMASLLVAANAEVPVNLPAVADEAMDTVMRAATESELGPLQLGDLLTASLKKDQIDHVLEGLETRPVGFVKALTGLLRARRPIQVDAQQLDAITAALELHQIRYRAYEFLAALRRTSTKTTLVPTPESMFRLMCNGDVSTLQMWVSNAMPSEPRREDITRILDGAMQRRLTEGEVSSLLHRVDFTGSPTWIDIIVDATSQVFFSILTNDKACEYMVKRVTACLGENPRAWSLLWTTLVTWEGSLGSALEHVSATLDQ